MVELVGLVVEDITMDNTEVAAVDDAKTLH